MKLPRSCQFGLQWLLLASVLWNCEAHAAPITQTPVVAGPERTAQWRRTKDGWIDLARWYRPKPQQQERRIETIHPLVVAGAIVFASSWLMIWAAEEADWSKVFRQTKRR